MQIFKKNAIIYVVILSMIIISAGESLTQDKEFTIKQSAENIQEKPWPKTVKDAVNRILSEMSEKDKETIRNTKKEDLVKFHHGWGTGIRNEFGLWSGNKKLLEDTREKHPDDASMVIIEAVWKALQKQK